MSIKNLTFALKHDREWFCAKTTVMCLAVLMPLTWAASDDDEKLAMLLGLWLKLGAYVHQ